MAQVSTRLSAGSAASLLLGRRQVGNTPQNLPRIVFALFRRAGVVGAQALRKLIYTTNAIESLHSQLRKIIKTRGHFPSDDAATKLIWLALRNITANHGRSVRV